jgi:hypothetical protein
MSGGRLALSANDWEQESFESRQEGASHSKQLKSIFCRQCFVNNQVLYVLESFEMFFCKRHFQKWNTKKGTWLLPWIIPESLLYVITYTNNSFNEALTLPRSLRSSKLFNTLYGQLCANMCAFCGVCKTRVLSVYQVFCVEYYTCVCPLYGCEKHGYLLHVYKVFCVCTQDIT